MIVTIDVGLKNLAIMVMDKNSDEYSIKLWDVYNLIDDEKFCSTCQKPAKIIQDNSFFCKRHYNKKTNFKELKMKKIKDYLLQDIVLLVVDCLNKLFSNSLFCDDSVSKIFIELQPKINNKMKLISHVIYTKFIEHFCCNKTKHPIIRFISAREKLKTKLYKGEEVLCKLKSDYAQRKHKAVCYTSWFINNLNIHSDFDFKEHFDKHKKKDDLADVFLMAINLLNK